MPVFEVIGVEHPLKKDREDSGAIEKLVFGPVVIVAKTDQQAAIQAVLKSDLAKAADQDRLEVLIRPFA